MYATHRAVLARAEAVDAEHIVLGPHRPHGWMDALWAFTAEQVVRPARVICLVARERLRIPFRRLVVAIDLSRPAVCALELALRWCGTLGTWQSEIAMAGAETRAVHVLPHVFEAGDPPYDRAMVGPRLHEELKAVVQAADGVNGVLVSEEVLWGTDPALSIVRYGRQEHADLVVLAPNGYDATRRVMQGSVSAVVVGAAPCPVVLVPPALWRVEEAPARTRGSDRRAELVAMFS